jgi:hypothetical protein
MTPDEALSLFRMTLRQLDATPEPDPDDEEAGNRLGEAMGDALYAAIELDRMLSEGEPLPKAWAAGQRLEIVHARPEEWGCQVAVFVGGREQMTEDRAYSYVDIDPAGVNSVEDWRELALAETDALHGYSPEFTAMVKQAYKQNEPKSEEGS